MCWLRPSPITAHGRLARIFKMFFISVHFFFSPLDAQRDTALDGLPNHTAARTKYADLYYTTMANSVCLGFIQIDQELAQNGHSGNSPHLNGTDSHVTGQILVLDWYQPNPKAYRATSSSAVRR